MCVYNGCEEEEEEEEKKKTAAKCAKKAEAVNLKLQIRSLSLPPPHTHYLSYLSRSQIKY